LSSDTLNNPGSLPSLTSYSKTTNLPASRGAALTKLFVVNSLLSGISGINDIPTGSKQTSTSTNIPTSSSSSDNSTNSKKSKAWIAGPVVGGVVGIAIIAGLSFWVWKLKSEQKKGGERVLFAEEKKTEGVGEGYPGMSAQQLDSRAVYGAPMPMGRAELEGAG
jgi:hypothetical protein